MSFLHTSLKGGEHFGVLGFFMSVIQILHEFQSGLCRVFGLFDFNTKQPNRSAWWTLVVAGHLVPLQL